MWILFAWVGVYFMLKGLVAFQTSPESTSWSGWVYASLLFVTSLLGTVFFHQTTLQSTRVGIQCRGALMVLIYRKSLKISFVKGGVGDIVNLISNDCNRIAEGCVNGHYLWAALLESAVLLFLTIHDVGISALPSLGLIFFVLFPLQYFLARNASAISYETTSLITKRVRLISEMLTAMKLIKFYAVFFIPF